MEEPGQKLRRVRERLNLRYRDVEVASQKIAQRHSNEEFSIALSRLSDIENKGTVPSVFRLYSLCAIYRLDLLQVMEWYGVPCSSITTDVLSNDLERTHLAELQPQAGQEAMLPLSLDPGFDLRRTTFLSRMVQRWGRLPLFFLNTLDPKNRRYGFIGTEDWSMFPLLPPGSFVMIDETRRKPQQEGWLSEFERPIYLFEHRDGFLCGWCSLEDGQLTVIPHPSSCEPARVFRFPTEIEIVGQITGVAMTLGQGRKRRTRS